MAVEIHILSGDRQGEQLVLDKKAFIVGSQSGSDVFFDPLCDSAVDGRTASFRLLADGWHIHGSGGRILVNQSPVAGWTHVRAGDIIRMSEVGPDFSFGIVGDLPTATTSPTLPSSKQQAEPPALPVAPPAPSPADYVIRPPLECETVELESDWPNFVQRSVIILLLGIIAGVVLPLFVFTMKRPSPSGTPSIAASVSNPTPETTAESHPSNVTPSEKQVLLDDRPTNGTAQPSNTASAPQDNLNKVAEALYLLQIEQADQSWPFASCVAIGGKTLLTTAREAMQLAKLRRDHGFKILVTQPATGFREEVDSILLNRLFAGLADKPSDWAYVNLGLLTIGGQLPHVASLASSDELSSLEPGVPLTCIGFTHEGEKTTRFDHFEPQQSPGKVYVITTSPNVPSTSSLLHIRAEIPKNVYGSPLVNMAGRIVGLYCEAAAPSIESPTAPTMKNMHYAAVVMPELIDLWLRDHDANVWIPADSEQASTQQQPEQ